MAGGTGLISIPMAEIFTAMKNKSVTKRKLINAVGSIIQTHGFKNVNISKVAREADVDRNLVYRYFKNLEGLKEAYVVENDYWMKYDEYLKELIRSMGDKDSEDLITQILQDQFRFFQSERDMQNLILMELSENDPLLKSIHRARENLGEKILATSDPYFRNEKVNFRAIIALLVGGIYYIILHRRFNGDQFSDLDVGSEEGQAALLRSIQQVVGWAFQEGGREDSPPSKD